MSKLKSMLGMYALAAMAMSSDLGGNNRERYIELKETEEERKSRLAKAEIERYKAQGVKRIFLR